MRPLEIPAIRIPLNREIFLTIFIGVVWGAMLLGYLRGIINHLPVLQNFTDQIEVLAVVVPLLLALPSLIHKFSLTDYLFYLLPVLYYLSCYIFFPENTSYLDEFAFQCLCCVYPYYFIGRITDINKMFGLLVLISTVCICMNLFYFLSYAPQQKNMDEVAGEDNMYTAYKVLPHVTILLWATFEKFRIWKAVMSFFGIMFLLSCGTRGPLVCLGFFGIIYFFFYMKFKGAAFVKSAIIALVATALFFLRDIAIFLGRTFIELKLSTRILEKIIANDIGNDSYRSVLRDKLYAVLDTGNHFFGLGLFGCRNYGIKYPHYIPLDFAGTFGYTIGYTLFALLALLIGMAIWISRGTKVQIFIILLFSLSMIKLMLTGTFVNEPYLYMLIGVCTGEILYHKTPRLPC